MPLIQDDDTAKKLLEQLKKAQNMRSYWSETRTPINIPAEQDEQGTMYGYKVLAQDVGRGVFISPVYRIYWNEDGTLQADSEPSERNTNGIYFMKVVEDREIENYFRETERRFDWYNNNGKWDSYAYNNPTGAFCVYIVKCALSGTIIEGERGFRAEYARIIEVYKDGHRYSYEEACKNSRRNSYQNPWEENGEDPRYTRKNPFIP